MMLLRTMQKISLIYLMSMATSHLTAKNYSPFLRSSLRCWKSAISKQQSATTVILLKTPLDLSNFSIFAFKIPKNRKNQKIFKANIFKFWITLNLNNKNTDQSFSQIIYTKIDKIQQITIINMNCWRSIILIGLILIEISSITVDNKQRYSLAAGQVANYTIKIENIMRYTFVQLEGFAEMKVLTKENETIANNKQSLFQGTFSVDTVGETLYFLITAGSSAAVGFLDITPVKKIEELHDHAEKFIHLRKGESRVIEIQPNRGAKLIIERFDGVPLFISNKCKNYERKECFDQMHRFDANPVKKHIETISLEKCSNCILLLKITTKSQNTRLRLSLEANRTTIQTYPTLALAKKGQTEHIVVHGSINSTGNIIVYSGQVQVSSDSIGFQKFDNGYTYIIKTNQSDHKNGNMITIKGLGLTNYIMIENPTNSTSIELIDGLPTSRFIEPNTTYRITYENHNEGKTNIVLASSSQFLQRLSITFTDVSSKEHYLIRPRFYFHSAIASQSFQLVPFEELVLIEMHLTGGNSGWLNITSEVNECISLPLDYVFSSILNYNEYDDYIIEGISGTVDVEIKKCVDCTLKYTISEQTIKSNPDQLLNNISLIQTKRLTKGSILFVRVQTNNYAYYSIKVKNHSTLANIAPRLPQQDIQFYLKEDSENNLLMEFHHPHCNQSLCKNATYYLLQGSDLKHLTSKIYCPFSLFDFDERTKDIIFQQITPTLSGSTLSYSRPLKHRDYIGIVAKIGTTLLPYKVINTEQVKLYYQMRWPFFYLSIFITTAVFCAFMIFMALRRKNQVESSGYIRTSTTGSLESIN